MKISFKYDLIEFIFYQVFSMGTYFDGLTERQAFHLFAGIMIVALIGIQGLQNISEGWKK